MKYCFLFIIMLALCLCSACGEAVPGFEKPQESAVTDMGETETYGPEPCTVDNYTFPPDEAELAWALKDAGLDWYINERPDFLRDIEAEDTIMLHLINNASTLVTSTLNLGYYYPPDGKYCNISFGYQPQTQEEYGRFQREDWPRFWRLFGQLFPSPEAIGSLGEQSMAYFNNYTGNGQGMLEWWGRQDDVYCHVKFWWFPALGHYALNEMYFMNPKAYACELESIASYRFACGYPRELSNVSEIDLRAAAEPDVELRLVKGHIEQLVPNEDVLDTSIFEGVPKNTDLYQKALLVDETGSLTVYLSPTALSEVELGKELLHFVNIVTVQEPYCVIDLSIANTDILK